MDATRQSLLERLRTPDSVSWEDFYALYSRPVVAYACKLGLEEAGAHDVLQETMVALMRALPSFRYDRGRGRFRNFLLTIVHRKTLAALRRAERRLSVPLETDAGHDGGGRSLLETLPAPAVGDPAAEDEARWQSALLEEALRRVKADPGVEARTFDVFRRYAIEGRPCEAVAAEFGLKPNAVYQIRNRMIRRLKAEVAVLEGR